jgi:predicted membrane channel-forming protein YqfA (hemolysin III family)
MYPIAIGWIYVVLMVALVEALSSTVIGAVFTFLLWGVLPLAIVLYVLRTPARRRQRRAQAAGVSALLDPDGSGHAAGHAVAAEREKP